MSRRARPANNMSKGVLDPLLAARTDLDVYNQGLKRGTNAIVLPQGGATRRGGLPFKGYLRNQLRRLPLTNGMLSGDPGTGLTTVIDKQISTEFRTTAGPSGATWPFLQVDLGSAQSIACVDLGRFCSSDAAADKCLGVETSLNGSAWTPLGRAYNVRTVATPRTRRFAEAPGSDRSARYIRVVIYGAPAIGAMGIGEIMVLTETTKPTVVRKLNFTFDRSQSYALFATDRSIEVYWRGAWQVSVPIPHRSSQLGAIARAQSSDLLLMLHGDVPPWTIFREGAHWEWDSYAQTFTNVPNLAGGTVFAVAQDEIQRVVIDGIAATDKLTLEVEGYETIVVTRGSNAATLAAAVKGALEGLPNVQAGLIVQVPAMSADHVEILVQFAGISAGGRVWPPLIVDVITNDGATFSVETIQDGRPSTGKVMQARTGWPRCGTFFQQRGIFGGFRLQPETVIGSVTGDFFNFDTDTNLGADAGVEYSLDSEEVPVIQQIFSGRHLQIFAEGSEWWMSDRAIDATQPSNFINSTRFGCRAGVDIVQIEGQTVFVQGSGDVLRTFAYSDTEQDYASSPLSIYASQLVTDVTDIAYRRAASTTQGSQLWAVNADGTIALVVSLKDEKVLATTPQVTDGAFKAVVVDADRRVMTVAERMVGGAARLVVEELDEACFFDFSEIATLAPPAAIVDGLDRLEGRTVWAMADGSPCGPFTVAGGAITLPRVAAQVEVGLWPAFAIEPMPDRFLGRDGSVRVSASRVQAAALSLIDTTSVAIIANGSPPRDLPLRQAGPGLMDVPQEAAPYTGELRCDGLLGHQVAATASVVQVRPGRLTLRAVLTETV